ncbi:pyridoxamine 5'-phosphate oxidase family protein [Nocardioides sp.]|uniref:pyridoxamine 5'-phosphate oxidase family protein n=1 Tax=Nocardioides sp. TaxID=35761 RepID=UPI003562D3CF
MMIELNEAESWELASSVPVGRIAWMSGSGPVIVPVNFVVHERRILLQTSAYSMLVREADESQVAFEVDEIDSVTRSGWSVLLRGTAHVRFHDTLGDDLPAVETWADGTRRMVLVIEVSEVTGRRVGAP